MNGRVSALIELGAGFHPEISGRENVAINGIMLGLTRREVEERFDEIVAFAELERFIDAPVKTYSSGMYARLGFAVAIHVDPDVLLIDEVLAVGDEAFTRKCLDKIGEFRRRGKTILLVTHSLGLVEKMCDEVLWLRQGKLADQGDPKRVVDAYLTYVAGGEEALLAREHGQTAARGGASSPASGAPARPSAAEGYREGRWGSREVEITSVRLLDDRGRERHVYVPGETPHRRPVRDARGAGRGLRVRGRALHRRRRRRLRHQHAPRGVRAASALDGDGRGRASSMRGPAAGRGDLPARRGRAPTRRHALRLPPRPVHLPREEPDQGRRRLPARAPLDVHRAGSRSPHRKRGRSWTCTKAKTASTSSPRR